MGINQFASDIKSQPHPIRKTPPAVVDAGIRALNNGNTHYTPALGLRELREAIANDYAPEVQIDASRVVCTPGASGALQLVFATLIGDGDEVEFSGAK